MDPLSLLRNSVMSGDEVTLDGDCFVFSDGLRFQRSIETNCASSKELGTYYTLEVLWFVAKNSSLSYPQYTLQCHQKGIPPVNIGDFLQIVAYLTGKKDTCTLITKSKTVTPVIPVPTTTKPSAPILRPQPTAPDIVWNEKLMAEKAKLAQKLDQREVTTTAAKKSLSQAQQQTASVDLEAFGLNEDKLKDVRSRWRKQREQKIAVPDDDALMQSEMQETGAFVEADAPVTRDITERECLARTRVSIFQSTKQFGNIFIPLGYMMKHESDPKKARHSQRAANNRNHPSWVDGKPKQADIESLPEVTKIKPLDEAIPPPPPPQSSPLPPPSTAVTSATTSSTRPSGNLTTRPPPSPLTKTPSARPNGPPIIIVPNLRTCPITLYNAKTFLQEGEWMSSDKLRLDGQRKPSMLEVERRKGKLIPVKYAVYDTIAKITVNDWDRIVAVFVMGNNWEFNGWKWGSVADILKHVRGFFLRFDDETIPPLIKAWDVLILTINKTKRHLDNAAFEKFWDALDQFTMLYKPYYYSH
ncbi:RNA polymerase II complex component [Pelomyxa schiedti]|nr:RNA polymerase II complex component [Pelomyxa schiedti]